jgi:hypothetical protein
MAMSLPLNSVAVLPVLAGTADYRATNEAITVGLQSFPQTGHSFANGCLGYAVAVFLQIWRPIKTLTVKLSVAVGGLYPLPITVAKFRGMRGRSEGEQQGGSNKCLHDKYILDGKI